MQARLKAAADEAVQNLRVRNALDGTSTNVMIANSANEIVYMNDTVTEMMSRNEAELRKTLPQFDSRRLIGQSIDLFHRTRRTSAACWARCAAPIAPRSGWAS